MSKAWETEQQERVTKRRPQKAGPSQREDWNELPSPYRKREKDHEETSYTTETPRSTYALRSATDRALSLNDGSQEATVERLRSQREDEMGLRMVGTTRPFT